MNAWSRLEVEYIEKYSIQYRLLSNLTNTILNTFFKKVPVIAYITEYIVKYSNTILNTSYQLYLKSRSKVNMQQITV